MVSELGRKEPVHDSKTELNLGWFGRLSQFFEVRGKVSFNLRNFRVFEGPWVSINGVLTDVDTSDFLNFLENGDNYKGIVFNFWSNLVLFSNLDSLELNY